MFTDYLISSTYIFMYLKEEIVEFRKLVKNKQEVFLKKIPLYLWWLFGEEGEII